MNSSLSERASISGLAARLSERGVTARVHRAGDTDARGADSTLDLELDGVSHRLTVQMKSRWTRDLDAQLDRMADDDSGPSWILVLPRLDATRRAWLRERGINHADMTGVVYLRLPGLLIHVDGGSKRQWGTFAASERAVNPFSKKASLVLRHFFESPNDTHSVTTVARETGIAVGWAWAVTEECLQRGYIAGTGDNLRLADAASALAHWCNAYTWTKSKRRSFVVPYSQHEFEECLAKVCAPSSLQWALTLLSGAQRRVGHVMSDNTTSLFCLSTRLATFEGLLTAVHAREISAPVPGTHTLRVIEPYYGQAALFGMALRDGLPVVSDLQLFLDLAHYPVRGVETAMHLLRTRLGPAVAMTPADMSRVERAISR